MKFEKEITVLVNDSYETLHKKLTDKKLKITEEFQLDDIYMFPKNINMDGLETLEILKHCVLLRKINNEEKKIIYKHKEYDENKNITIQGRYEFLISDIDEAIKFFEAINYIKLFEINDHCIAYSDGVIELLVQILNDENIFIEIEDVGFTTSKVYENINEMIKDLDSLELNYDKSNYFVKKAELVFDEKYKK